MPDNSAEIAALETVLNSGARSVSVDGVTTTFENAEQIRRRLRELRETDTANAGRRPRISTIDIGASY